MMRFVFAVLLNLLPAAVWANCAGLDLRQTLPAQELAVMQDAVAQIPYAEGNRFTASKEGRRIDLVGTMHLSDPRFDPVLERLRPVVAKADAILFEITQQDMAAFEDGLKRDQSPLLITDSRTLIELMEPDAWERLATQASAAGIPPWLASKMRPWFLSVTLALPPCLREQKAAAGNGLDRRLSALASDLGVPQVSLETMEEILAIFEKDPLEEQVRLLEASLSAMAMNEDSLATASNLYFEERAALAMKLGEYTFRIETRLPKAEKDRVWRDFETDMLDTRNRAWMDTILTHPGKNIVVAVGAAHLSGDAGLLRLLEQEGYVIQREVF
ncbi:MAG: TraB/GumN family protein [Rhodobacteraceae bacterium]|nr:TraB/GumN family protein [Paracoccaceae bacterium]